MKKSRVSMKPLTLTLVTFGETTPLSAIFIRTRQIVRALRTLNNSVNLIELGYGGGSSFADVLKLQSWNMTCVTINCISQAPSKFSRLPLIRSLAFQAESLKTMSYMRLLRKSSAVVITSCLQIFPALISKLLGAKIVLDINDVNSRATLRIQDTMARAIRYFFWRPLESFGCVLANIVLINKEEEGEFLTTHLHVHQSKILVLKTCLEENQSQNDKRLKSELEKFTFGDKRIVLFLANMKAFMNQGTANYILKELAPSFAESDEFNDVVFVLAGIGSDNLQPLTSNVITTGTLSETSVHALIDRADICIDPATIAGGVKTKIQHYLKRSRVIVTTPAGAEGINLYGRKDVAFLKTPIERFENTLIYALRNLENLKKLAVNNCEIYERQFSWNLFLAQISNLLQKISATHHKHKGDV